METMWSTLVAGGVPEVPPLRRNSLVGIHALPGVDRSLLLSTAAFAPGTWRHGGVLLWTPGADIYLSYGVDGRPDAS